MLDVHEARGSSPLPPTSFSPLFTASGGISDATRARLNKALSS